MPTRRTAVVLSLSLLLYFFANQTQVGWLYVMSALLAGVVAAAFFLNRRALKGVEVTRRLGAGPGTDIYEEDELEISLGFRNAGRMPAAHIRTVEHCPLADPDSEYRRLDLFLPSLPAGREAGLGYSIQVYRRGVHRFPPLELASRAPFGFFSRKAATRTVLEVLVYPELRELKGLPLLDRQPAQMRARPRAGHGTEIIGVRPYRPGDSPRHIHWRSTARTGKLISKEFVDEARPGVTMALDLFPYPYPDPEGKHTPFEWMVKLAASIGDYAVKRGFPLHLLTDEAAWPVPRGPLTGRALMEFLARVHPAGEVPLARLLADRPTRTFVAALVPWPDPEVVRALTNLHNQGQDVLAVVLAPDTFPAGGDSARAVTGALRASGIPTADILFGEDWVEQLEARLY